MLTPNSYSLVSKDKSVPVNHPIVKLEHDVEYKRRPDWPRVYHKYLVDRDKQNIYGTDVADQSESNVAEIDVLPLNAQQEDFLDIEEPAFIDE